MLILIKRSIAFNIVWRESIPDAFEIICCDLNLPQSTLRVIVVYRTPSCNLNDSIQLCKVLSDLCSFQGHSIITGDFNFPDIDWKENLPRGTSTVSQRFTEICTSTKLVQKVREPTRGKHILDLVLCSQANLIKGVNVSSPVGSSDHFCLSYEIIIPIHRLHFRSSGAYHKANYDAICISCFPLTGGISWKGFLILMTNMKFFVYSTFLHSEICTT